MEALQLSPGEDGFSDATRLFGAHFFQKLRTPRRCASGQQLGRGQKAYGAERYMQWLENASVAQRFDVFSFFGSGFPF